MLALPEKKLIFTTSSQQLCIDMQVRSRMRCVSVTFSQDIEKCAISLSWNVVYSIFVTASRQHKTFILLTQQKYLPSTVHHMVCTIEEELPSLPAKSTDLPFPQMQCPKLCVLKRFAVCKLAAGQWHQAERCRLWKYFWEEKLNYHYYQIHLQPSLVQWTTTTHSSSKKSQSKVIRNCKKYSSTSSAVCLHDLRQKLQIPNTSNGFSSVLWK